MFFIDLDKLHKEQTEHIKFISLQDVTTLYFEAWDEDDLRKTISIHT